MRNWNNLLGTALLKYQRHTFYEQPSNQNIQKAENMCLPSGITSRWSIQPIRRKLTQLYIWIFLQFREGRTPIRAYSSLPDDTKEKNCFVLKISLQNYVAKVSYWNRYWWQSCNTLHPQFCNMWTLMLENQLSRI